MADSRSVCIVGGGIFGLTAAILLLDRGHRVTVIEQRDDVMQEASLVNQNRIHLGYHYPRSPQTAREAIAGLKSFGAMFGPAIVSDFTKYYAISRDSSMTTVDEFVDFCDQVGLSLETQWPPDRVLDRTTVHACWAVPETIFDYHHLRQIVTERLSSQSRFTLLRRCRPTRVELGPPHRVTLSDGRTLRCDILVNAAYAGIADVLALIDCPPPPIQFELCVMPIMEIDDPPPRFGVTVMDGPFCSLMPKGRDAGRFIVYHVDRSVVQRQVDDRHPEWQPLAGFVEQEIVRASQEYFPILERMRVRESWISTRVVLAATESDDARPTLLFRNGDGVCTVFSGKLTTCVDAAVQIVEAVEGEEFPPLGVELRRLAHSARGHRSPILPR